MKLSKKGILKTFIQNEPIQLSIDGVKTEATFVRVSGSDLTILNKEGKEETIPLQKITSITL